MAKLQLVTGTTSKLLKIFVPNSSVSTGAGLTGLTSGSSGLIAYYIREGANATTAITLTSATLGTFTSSGFVEVDASHMPGVYELGIPNAALAAGAKSVLIMLSGATNMTPVVIEIELTAIDNQLSAISANVTQWNGSNVPTPNVFGVPLVDLKYTLGTISPAAAGSVALDWGQISNKTTTNALTGTSFATSQVVASVTNAVATTSNLKKNTQLANYMFLMTDNATGFPLTGLVITATRSLDGAAFAGCANSASEVGNGIYKITLAAADMNANVVALRFTSAGANDLDIVIVTQP